jgi:hypothetical protein
MEEPSLFRAIDGRRGRSWAVGVSILFLRRKTSHRASRARPGAPIRAVYVALRSLEGLTSFESFYDHLRRIQQQNSERIMDINTNVAGGNVRELELRRCEELWFDDGTVVLEAEGIGFKVYRGHPARNSSVFADMFSIALPKLDGQTFDGCALIQLSDPSEQLRYFLLAMNDSTYDFF